MNERFFLMGPEGRVIFDSHMETVGEFASPEVLASATYIKRGDEIMGYLLFGQPVGNTLEAQFFDRVNSWLLWSGLGTGAVALLLAFFLARQITAPVRRLTQAANDMSAGNLTQRVDVANQDELGELAGAFNHMSEQLEQAEQQRRLMVADIAHELRNPLSVMQGKLEGLMDGVLPLDRDQVGTVYGQTLLLSRLVEDLRLLSLAQAGRLPLEKSEVDMGVVVSRVVDDFAPIAQERVVSLDTRVDDRDLRSSVDPQRIGQVLANLLSNAVRHAGRGGEVTVRVTRENEDVRVAVADNGSGIGPEDLAHVFERFYRVDRSRSREEGGSGLGLAIAKEVVEAHGGEIWVESIQGEGAVFTFSVPAAVVGAEGRLPAVGRTRRVVMRSLRMS